MPRVTLYIRDSDYDKWKLIENKSELVSQAINRSVISVVEKPNGKLMTNQEILPPEPVPEKNKTVRKRTPPTTMEDKLAGMQKDQGMKFCPNGHAIPDGRTKCMGKGCKYA